jgi:hypothetical protein
MVTQEQPFASGSSYVLMCTIDKDKEVSLTTRAKDYPSSNGSVIDHPSTSTPPPTSPLQIDQPSSETLIRPPPKGVVHRSSFNLHARATQNYSILEDLAQAPSAMSTLEVLQTFPMQ